MASSLHIPTVNVSDLETFHLLAFGRSAPAQSLPLFEPSPNSQAQSCTTNDARFEEEDDDDLGHYPDGRKRTLTDDQIEMFRHSEIYAIVRQRQIKRENDAAEGIEPDIKTELAVSAARSEHGDHDKEDGKARQDARSGDRKRKRDAQDIGRRLLITNRGLVRELDDLGVGTQELDYDGIPSVSAIPAPDASSDSTSKTPEENIGQQGRKIWWPVLEG